MFIRLIYRDISVCKIPLQMCARYFYLAHFVFFKKFLIIPENYAVIYRIKASNYLFKVMKHFVSYRETLCFKCLKQMGTTVNRKEQLSNHSRRCARYFYLAHICNGILHTIISLCINRINAKSVGVQDNYGSV